MRFQNIMVIIQDKPKRKATGGRYSSKVFYKRKHRKGNNPALTIVGDKRVKTVRTLGGNKKPRLTSINKVNVMNTKTKKSITTDIKTILENPANRHFIRRNIISKGAVIDTPRGKARVTNRPSQEGFVNAVLV